MTTSHLILTIVFWVLVAAFLLPGYLHGIQKVVLQKEKVATFSQWNYSMRTMQWLGVLEIAGASLLLFPVTRIFAIPFYAILLSGAVYTHMKNNDTRQNTLVPVFVGLHFVVIMVLNIWV